jgi:hypothetical protein
VRAQTTREQSQVFFALIVAEHQAIEKRQQDKDAAEASAKKELAKGEKEREAAEAAVKTELAHTKAELARMQLEAAKKPPNPLLGGNADAAASNSSYAAEVDAIMGDLLGAAGLDATLKRDVEAKLELLNKRRKV